MSNIKFKFISNVKDNMYIFIWFQSVVCLAVIAYENRPSTLEYVTWTRRLDCKRGVFNYVSNHLKKYIITND